MFVFALKFCGRFKKRAARFWSNLKKLWHEFSGIFPLFLFYVEFWIKIFMKMLYRWCERVRFKNEFVTLHLTPNISHHWEDKRRTHIKMCTMWTHGFDYISYSLILFEWKSIKTNRNHSKNTHHIFTDDLFLQIVYWISRFACLNIDELVARRIWWAFWHVISKQKNHLK